MEPFISDTHRSSVQGYLCFSTRLIRHAFFQSVCVCVLAPAWKAKEPLYPSLSFDHPSDPLWWLSGLLSTREDSQRHPTRGPFFVLPWGFADSVIYFFSLDSFEVSLNKSTDKHIHVRDTHSNTPLILTHTTTALRPFAFPTVYSCQAPWQPYGFFQWQ